MMNTLTVYKVVLPGQLPSCGPTLSLRFSQLNYQNHFSFFSLKQTESLLNGEGGGRGVQDEEYMYTHG